MTNDVELREFAYLDSLSVYSLLASIGEPVIQQEESLDEHTENTSSSGNLEGEVNLEGRVGELVNRVSSRLGASGSLDLSKSKTARDLLRTTSRVNDQYRFDKLHRELEDNITELPANTNQEEGDVISISEDTDVIKVTGTIETDPLYRLVNTLTKIQESFGKQTPKSMKNMLDLYGGKIPLILSTDESDKYNYIMTIEESSTWIDELQDFWVEMNILWSGVSKDE